MFVQEGAEYRTAAVTKHPSFVCQRLCLSDFRHTGSGQDRTKAL